MFSDFDHAMMQRALALAEKGLFTTTPNPRVGCVIVRDDTVIGEGYTQPAGQDHALLRHRRQSDPDGLHRRDGLAACMRV